MNPFSGLSGLALDYLNEIPEAGWGAYLGAFGLGGDPYSQWLRGQQKNYYTQFMGANASDPSLSWTGYLGKIDPKADFAKMNPWSRGENPRAWAGRTRWSL